MSDQKDPGIKLFGRVIPLAPEAPAPGAAEAEEEEPQLPVQEEAAAAAAADDDEDQRTKQKDKENSEMKVDASQEKDNEMNVDAPQEKDDEMNVEAPQEKDNEMNADAPQEKDNDMNTLEEKKETEIKVDVQQEKEDEEIKSDTPDIKESLKPDNSSNSDHKKEDQAQLNSAEDKAASDPKGENEQTENDESGQDKALKKPDKILPCPRCNSMDTKFCYYNNYNVNQPRHFCKNCQRYWTAGGTMRNVPVGAGRRKSKNSSLHYRQLLMAPDCIMVPRADISKSVFPEILSSPSVPMQPTSRNETVVKFGTEVPVCESMVSALNIDEQNITNVGSAPRGENTEDNSCASPVMSYNGMPKSKIRADKNGASVYCDGVTQVPQYYLGTPFMYPWNVGWNNIPVMVPGGSMPESAASEGCSTSSAPWMNSPVIAPSRLPAPAFPYPLGPPGPPALWGCLSGWPGTTWNIPWIRTNGCMSPSSSSNSSCSGNGSPTLGKHSRDSNPLKEEEKSLWIPKTLRIDDPDEAAKSSIWATLGIKPGDPAAFKPFRSKVGSKGQKSDAAQVLQANPAALSRSQSFQESS